MSPASRVVLTGSWKMTLAKTLSLGPALPMRVELAIADQHDLPLCTPPPPDGPCSGTLLQQVAELSAQEGLAQGLIYQGTGSPPPFA